MTLDCRDTLTQARVQIVKQINTHKTKIRYIYLLMCDVIAVDLVGSWVETHSHFAHDYYLCIVGRHLALCIS